MLKTTRKATRSALHICLSLRGRVGVRETIMAHATYIFRGGAGATIVRTTVTAVLAALTLASSYAGTEVDYTKMGANELAEYLIFQAGGFKLDQPVQEGGTAKQRLVQDELQKVCSKTRNKPSPEQAAKIIADAKATIKYPEGGIKIGDWKKGGEIAWSGFGYRVGPELDDHSKRQVGGNCYNCHQIATDRQGGTLGPSLTGYGTRRGTSQEILRLTYGIIYNAHSVFPCTRMPRQGANGLLTQEEILDVMAYLFDPQSPVNQ
jgi:sulfur-oxidizing protein SoxX